MIQEVASGAAEYDEALAQKRAERAVRLIHGDSRDVIPTLGENVFDSCVCDPPYALQSIVKRFGADGAAAAKAGQTGAFTRASAGFMGKRWDTGETAFDPEFWRLVWVALKPGAYLIAFGGSRTYHRLACAIEDAGFIIHPLNGWIFGSGFPKATDLTKQLDRANGATRATRRAHNIQGGNLMEASQGKGRGTIEYSITEAASAEAKAWDGWRYGTQSQKPALEPICFAQKPIDGNRMIDNIRKWGVGAVNVDACRVGTGDDRASGGGPGVVRQSDGWGMADTAERPDGGRWPANLCHDGSNEVIAAFPGDLTTGRLEPHHDAKPSANGSMSGGNYAGRIKGSFGGDTGSAARFFYSAKADADDRWGSKHPTVKPIDLIRHYVRFITPPGGLVLDPFAGSGTTGVACFAEGMRAVMIEREAEYVADIEARLAFYRGEGAHSLASKGRKIEPAKASGSDAPLFAQVVA